jgi:MFS family permease
VNPFRRNLHIAAGVRLLDAMLFSIPIITLYWGRNGLDLQDIFWLQAIFALSVVVFEIPTGAIGDRLGRKKTLLLSAAITATAGGSTPGPTPSGSSSSRRSTWAWALGSFPAPIQPWYTKAWKPWESPRPSRASKAGSTPGATWPKQARR